MRHATSRMVGAIGALTLSAVVATAPVAVGSSEGVSARSETDTVPSKDADGSEPTPVRGQRGTANGARLLKPGLYRTKAPGPYEEDTRYFQVARTMAGSTLHVGVMTRANKPYDEASLDVTLLTPDGDTCDDELTWGQTPERPRYILLDVVVSSSDDQSECARSDRLVLALKQGPDWWGEDFAGTSVLLAVNEVPRARNPGTLPKPSTEDWTWRMMSSSANRTKVEGAPGLPDPTSRKPPPLEPGSYRSTIDPGESLAYRVELDWGESVQALVQFEGLDEPIVSGDGQEVGIQIIGPTLGNARVSDPVELNDDSDADLGEPITLRAMTPPVQYRNRTLTDHAWLGASMSGSYYVVVSREGSPPDKPIPFTLVLDVRGSTDDGPEYAHGDQPKGPAWRPEQSDTTATSADANADADADADAGDDGGGVRVEPAAVALGGGGLALVVIGSVTLIGLRRADQANQIR